MTMTTERLRRRGGVQPEFHGPRQVQGCVRARLRAYVALACVRAYVRASISPLPVKQTNTPLLVVGKGRRLAVSPPLPTHDTPIHSSNSHTTPRTHTTDRIKAAFGKANIDYSKFKDVDNSCKCVGGGPAAAHGVCLLLIYPPLCLSVYSFIQSSIHSFTHSFFLSFLRLYSLI